MYCQNPSCMYYMLIFLYRFNSIILIIDFFNKYDSTLVYWLRVHGWFINEDQRHSTTKFVRCGDILKC